MQSLSFRPLSPSRRRRIMRRLSILILAGCAGAAAGLLGALQPADGGPRLAFVSAPAAFAQSHCGVNPACPFGDTNVTSVLDVDHRVSPGGLTDDPVQLDDSETVGITAWWYSESGIGTCSCSGAVSASVSMAMSHSGTSWSGVCTGCDAVNGPIYGVTVCDINSDNCSSYDGDYRLIVNIMTQNGNVPGVTCSAVPVYLERVEYAITAIDDGDAFDPSTCNLGAAVSPTQNAFSATDNGAFECPFNCSQTGTAVTVIFN